MVEAAKHADLSAGGLPISTTSASKGVQALSSTVSWRGFMGEGGSASTPDWLLFAALVFGLLARQSGQMSTTQSDLRLW